MMHITTRSSKQRGSDLIIQPDDTTTTATSPANTRHSTSNNKKVSRADSLKTIRRGFQRVRRGLQKFTQNVSNAAAFQTHKPSSRDGSAGDIRVPPTLPPHIPPDKQPGIIGLRNHGNTCFMNAVLQCLSHTDKLAEYFVLDRYKSDLMRKNKLSSKKYGTKGEITEQLATLLKAIWSCQYDPEMSTSFKSVVDKYGSQYRGNLQHDAQEFLLWLLDKVHEDLNQARDKKYRNIKVSVVVFFCMSEGLDALTENLLDNALGTREICFRDTYLHRFGYANRFGIVIMLYYCLFSFIDR